jgi:hypothetical protein
MSNANPSRLGQANATGSDTALFLEKFSGRVLMTFEATTLAKSRSTVETEDWGKAITINEVGDATTEEHVPGAEILGEKIKEGERTIVPEQMIISSVFVADYDKLLAHFEMQSRYAQKIGVALAERYDRDVFRNIILASQSTPSGDELNPSDPPANEPANAKSGGDITLSGGGDPVTDADAFITLAIQAAEMLDTKNVLDRDDRTLWVTPASYWLLASSGTAIVNRDFGGEGSVAGGMVTRVGNLQIVKSNNLASVLGTSDQTTLDPSCSYLVNPTSTGTNTLALVSTPEAVITGEWLGITSESAYDIRRQGTLLLSKMVKGTGILRPECAVNLRAS